MKIKNFSIDYRHESKNRITCKTLSDSAECLAIKTNNEIIVVKNRHRTDALDISNKDFVCVNNSDFKFGTDVSFLYGKNVLVTFD